ncbi:MAG: L-seryl-tRNA(Sec) selenium transferase, partial [Gemmatimonadales bacterium]
VAALVGPHPRRLVVRAVREVLDAVRAQGGVAPVQGWAAVVRTHAEALAQSSLLPVINATGVVLHTNLGRAPLAPAALRALTRVAAGYAALEYDLGRGTRGSRHAHCRDLLVDLTGAADALVVNNAAGALLLALSALGRGGEAVVSRGELVEIGGSFRIPDILARSGATLVEVGTTNRTHLDDYRKAIGPPPATRLLLKVHRSNFQVTGFTTDVAARDLAALARERGVASLYDLGSGLLLDLAPWGLAGEPTVQEALAAGVDLVVFSGDKLLGGPQAGILVGAAPAIEACRTDPIARAVRADKLTLAALEATLALYRDPETARREIPVLRMLTESLDVIRRRAAALHEVAARTATARLIDGESEVGGGSFPGAKLPTVLVELKADQLTADGLAARLRAGVPPVIARIERDRVLLDPRTIADDQLESARRALAAALDG